MESWRGARRKIMASLPLIYLQFACYLVLTLCSIAAGKNCETLDGKWYNQLGSEVYIEHDENGKLWGEYRTARERFNGSAGPSHSVLFGKYLYISSFKPLQS